MDRHQQGQDVLEFFALGSHTAPQQDRKPLGCKRLSQVCVLKVDGSGHGL
jgi:hypothetical protein